MLSQTTKSRSAIISVVALLCISCVLMIPAPLHAATPGQVNLVRNATSAFDGYTAGATPIQQRWIDAHYSSMRGYAPFFNQALPWAPPTDFYRDLYAIYRQGSRTPQHDDWILKDSSGRYLYIPAACNGSYCTQYAGDVGNPEFRRAWIAEAKAELAKGYHGIFIDDVNMTITVSDATGAHVTPIDPRTGRAMTEEDWRRYVAEFTEEVRAAMPGVEIVHNTPWFENQNDTYVRREIASADTIELERAFGDGGLTGGIGTFSFSALLAHIDWLHSLGKSVMFEPYIESKAERELNLAGYFLVNTSTDSLVTSYETDPGSFWQGWETNLGAALAPRYEWHGLLRRDFESGFVLLDPPGGPSATVPLSIGYTTADGEKVQQVHLNGRQAVVLLTPLAPAGESGSENPTGAPEAQESPTTEEAESPTAGSPGSGEAPGAELPVSITTPTEASQQVGIMVSMSSGAEASPSPSAPATSSIESVGSATVTGAVPGTPRIKVRLQIQARTSGGGWKPVRVAQVLTGRDGSFQKRVEGLGSGHYRVQAGAGGHPVYLRSRSFNVA